MSFLVFCLFLFLPCTFITYVSILPVRYQECLRNCSLLEEQAARLQREASEAGEERTRAEGELGVEREWRLSLEQSVNKDRNRIAELQREVSQLRDVSVVSVLL